MRGVFDIVGPIMIGPSSSHTAGAARLGLMAGKILGEPVAKAEILLHGSFARTYRGHGTDKALIGVAKLMKSEPKAYKKLLKLAEELEQHPLTGTGKPEPLSGDRSGQWSRRITRKHRMIYEIHDTEVIVILLSAYGHYDDK